MKISFELKFLFIFLLIALSIYAFSAITYHNNKLLSDSNYLVNYTHQVLYKSEKVLSILKDMEIGTRGFLITRDSSYLTPYFLAKENINANLQQLDELTAGDSIQHLRVDSLRSIAAKRIELATIVSKLKPNGYESNQLLLTVVANGKVEMDKIRNLISKIEADENRLLILRQRINDQHHGNLKITLYVLLATMLFIFILAYFIMRYNFLRVKEGNKALFQLSDRMTFLNKKIDDIIEGISDPFFALDKNWEFIYLNSAAHHKMSVDKGSVIGSNIFDVFARYKDSIVGKNLLLVRQTQQPISFEAYDELVENWQDFTIYPTVEGVTVYIKDATERKANEKELLKTKQFLLETNEIALVGGWEVDLKMGTVYWTDVTRQIHETPLGFVPDLETGINFYKEGKSRDKIITVINKAIVEGIAWDTELQIITAKGNERWIRTKGKTELDENNICVRLYGSFQDIDEQKKLDYKLKQSEKQFRSAFENSAIGLALVNPDGNWKEVNQALCAIVGYSQTELLTLSFQDITHPDDLDSDLVLLKELVAEKIQNYQIEKRYFRKDGHVVCVLLAVSMVKDQQGNIIHFIFQLQDITEKRKADKALQAERKLLRTIIDNLPLNVYLKDLQSKKILVNKREMDYMGASDEAEILGKSDYDLYPENSAEISIAEDHVVFKTGKGIINKETLSYKKDGSETWFLSSKIPFINDQNEITGLLGISFDMTERKEINRALEATKQKLGTLFDLSPVGFALSELKSGRFIEFNKSFANKLGYTTEELTKLDRLTIKPKKYWESEISVIQSLNDEKRYFGPIETEHIRKDGSTYPILLNGLRITDAEGREFIWTVIQDITNLKNKEVELKRLNISLEESYKELSLKNDELEQFAYVASHDLQEPLRMVTGFLSKIERKYDNLLDDDGRKYIHFAVDGATRMRQLITDILDYSRLGNTAVTEAIPIELNILVKAIIESLKNIPENKNVEIHLDSLPIITADKASIQQLFSNLISNGVKYQMPGNNPVIKINVEDKNDFWQFSIADNGIGIDPKYFDKVFNVFQRLHTKEKYSGTGIGLAICKKIIHNLKGDIWIESIPGSGTTFYFTLKK